MADIKLKLEEKGFDFTKLTESMEKELKTAIRGLAYKTYDDITQAANKSLYSSRQDYIKSLSINDLANDTYVILLKEPGTFYEDGFDAFDQLLHGLARGPKSKQAKDGHRYVIIPFKHHPASKDIKPLSNNEKPEKLRYQKELQDAVKTMSKLKQPRAIRDRTGKIIGHITHKGGIKGGYTAGMIKVEHKYEKAKQSTYTTFRVASEKVQGQKWLHKGFKGVKLFDQAEKILDKQIDNIINIIIGD